MDGAGLGEAGFRALCGQAERGETAAVLAAVDQDQGQGQGQGAGLATRAAGSLRGRGLRGVLVVWAILLLRPAAAFDCRVLRFFARASAATAVALTLGSDCNAVLAAERNSVRYTTTPSGVQYYDYRATSSSGEDECRLGSKVVLEVKGYLAGRNGWQYLDTTASADDEDVVRLTLGQTPCIRGLELGLLGEPPSMPPMHKGDKRRLVLPSRLGYTSQDQQPIPQSDDFRRRLYSTVLNQQRSAQESRALGDSVVGELVLDVEVLRVKNRQ